LSHYKAVIYEDRIVVQLQSSIEYDGNTVEFGNINVIISFDSGSFFIKAEPDPGNFRDGHYHPNISQSHNICLGDAQAATRQALNRFDFLSAVSLIDSMLNHNTGGTPYLSIDSWLEQCADEDNACVCPVCDEEIADDDDTIEHRGSVCHACCIITVDQDHSEGCGGGTAYPANLLVQCDVCKTSVKRESTSIKHIMIYGARHAHSVCADCDVDMNEDARSLDNSRSTGNFICSLCGVNTPVARAVVLSRNHVYCDDCAVLAPGPSVKIVGHLYGYVPTYAFNPVSDTAVAALFTLTYRSAPGIRSEEFYTHIPMPDYISPRPVLVRCGSCNTEHTSGVINNCKLTSSDICPSCPGADMSVGISAITSISNMRGFLFTLLTANMHDTLLTHMLNSSIVDQLDLDTGVKLIKQIVAAKTANALPNPMNATGWRALLNTDNLRIMR
jgi:hypothetical protein